MAVFDFDKVEEYVQSSGEGFNFLKLADDRWSAKVRFMYGPGEIFKGYAVHNVSQDPMKPKYIPCLRELGQPLDVCPLCKASNPVVAQFYIPLYVLSITKVINGITQPEEPVNQVMLFQRGKTFKGALDSVIRQSGGTPLVNNIFNIVRNGKMKDPKTQYLVEFAGRDNTTLDQLPEFPEIFGSYILPNVSYNEMLQYVNNQPISGIVPRTISANPINTNQISPNVPF